MVKATSASGVREAGARALGAWGLAALMVVGSAAGGCTQAHARTTPVEPALDMPSPPPHVIESEETSTPPPVPLVEEPARHMPPQPPRQAAPRQDAATREAPKSEPPKPEVPVEAAKPPEPPAVKPSTTTLQTTPAGAEEEVEKAIRGVLAHASGDLKRVDYRGLNPDARAQYDSAKRFVVQAEEALQGKNLVFAKNLADKAAAIAAQLLGR